MLLYLCREIFSMRRFAFQGMPMPLAFTETTGSIQSTCMPYKPLIWSYTLFLQFRPFHTYLFLRCHHTSPELPTGSLYIFFFAVQRSMTVLLQDYVFCLLPNPVSLCGILFLASLGQKCSKLWQALRNHSFL